MATKLSADAGSRRLRILRFGLLTVVCISWAVSFVLPFALAQLAGNGWVRAALLPSVLYTAATAAICVIVYQLYKRLLVR